MTTTSTTQSEPSQGNDLEPNEEDTSDVDWTPISSPQEYFEEQVYLDADTGTTIQYLFHQPTQEKGKSYPLVIFLHGLGDTVNMQTMGTATNFVNSMLFLENESKDYRAYTLVPSTPLAHEGGWTYEQLEAFKRLIYQMPETYNIDTKRVYITGISMGGFTTCQLVNQMPPNTFAAAAPLSGSQMMTNPETLFNTAFHIYHSTNDTVVNVSCSRNLYQQLLIANHPKVEYTEFASGNHTSPLYSVYSLQCYEFFGWMFAQRLP